MDTISKFISKQQELSQEKYVIMKLIVWSALTKEYEEQESLQNNW